MSTIATVTPNPEAVRIAELLKERQEIRAKRAELQEQEWLIEHTLVEKLAGSFVGRQCLKVNYTALRNMLEEL